MSGRARAKGVARGRGRGQNSNDGTPPSPSRRPGFGIPEVQPSDIPRNAWGVNQPHTTGVNQQPTSMPPTSNQPGPWGQQPGHQSSQQGGLGQQWPRPQSTQPGGSGNHSNPPGAWVQGTRAPNPTPMIQSQPSPQASESQQAVQAVSLPPQQSPKERDSNLVVRPRTNTSQVGEVLSGMAAMSLQSREPRKSRAELKYTEPNTRPSHIIDKKGSGGTSFEVKANFFRLESQPDWCIYHYHVEFNPTVDSKRLRQGIVREHAKKFVGETFEFDGMALYTITKSPNEMEQFVATAKYSDQPITVTMKRVAILPSNSAPVLQVLNNIMKSSQKDMGMTEIQRNYYSPHLSVKLPQYHTEIWPGFKTSILPYEQSLLLNIDISHKLLRTETVAMVLDGVWNESGGNPIRAKESAIRKLIGMTVMTKYNNKTYRIDDIDWTTGPAMSFPKKDGTSITFVEYYKAHYGITVRQSGPPLLITRAKRKDATGGAVQDLLLIPELCFLTGLDEAMKANYNVKRDLDVHMKSKPPERAQALMKFRNDMATNEAAKDRLQKWNIGFSNDLVKITARSLQPEKIFYGPERAGSTQMRSVDAGPDADWGRTATRFRLYTTVPLQRWIVVYFERNADAVEAFLNAFREVAPPMGMQVHGPTRVRLATSTTAAFIDAIKANIYQDLQLVVTILPSKKKDLYDAIKKQCCINTAVINQCITFGLLKDNKKRMSAVSKIAVQIQCKLSAEPWAVMIPGPLANNMVIGIDTYHDSAKKGRSVGGFVASLNRTFTRYYSQTTMQTSMQELIDGLKNCMTAALKKYHSINGVLPVRIFVYRDGVGDGQLAAVTEHELTQILDAIKSVGDNYNPEIVVIIVKKRINARFFKGNNIQGLTNPPPGTVIDDVVTKPEWYDFFLISQSVRQGTVTPTHYNVIWDTSTNLGPAKMQKLTYKLTHLYYNWPGTIRVPAPCQYAHKLAFLTGQSLHRQPDLALADKLYYL